MKHGGHRWVQGAPAPAGQRFTVIGAGGFLGGFVVARLREIGSELRIVPRDAPPDALLEEPLGYVIDCAGLTGDFRTRPFDTVEAHVARLAPLMRHGRFSRYVYTSSTRVYRRGTRTDEDAPVAVHPHDPDDLYDLSKLMGESFALRTREEAVVARLSNLYGPDPGAGTFLPQVVRAAVGARGGTYAVRQAPSTSRDYVSVRDAARWLIDIATRGAHRAYNVASGVNVSNADVTAALERLTGARAVVAEDAPDASLAPIDARRLHDELGGPRHDVLSDLPALVADERALFDSGASP